MRTSALSSSLPRTNPSSGWVGGARGAVRRELQHELRREAGDSDLFATRLHPDRELRVAASFCATQEEAVWLHRRLSAHPRLAGEQLHLLKPVDALPRRFARWQTAWDGLRPLSRRAMAPSGRRVWQAGGLSGLLLGLAISLLADLSMAETVATTALCLLLALGLVVAGQWAVARTARPRRFDQVLAQRLAQGEFAVVVTGVRDASTAADAIALMRSVGLYWCAETPRRSA